VNGDFMALKRCISFRKGFCEFSFESDPKDLSNDVIKVCSVLKKGALIIEVFSQDPLRDAVLLNAHIICHKGNMSYYLCDDIGFLYKIDFASAMHIGIYSVLDADEQKVDAKYLNENFTFFLCFENYLDTSRLTVCRKYYPNGLESDLCSSSFFV
jgi:hypothetical protein